MRNYIVCATAIFVAISATPSRAAVIHVPADQPTIQAGINAAVNGDTVLVAAGTYTENLNPLGKAIAIVSESGPESTILSGIGLNTSIFRAVSGETRATKLVGFTLSGAHLMSGIGGGIYCSNGSPTISGCNIIDNYALGGAAAYITGPSSPLFADNLIADNSSNGDGGAVTISWAGSPTFLRNHFRRNQTGNHGAAIYSAGSVTVARNNLFTANVCPNLGSAYLATSQARDSVINNTFYANGPGECVVAFWYSTLDVALNNIFAFNHSTAILQSSCAAYTANYNDFYANIGGSYNGLPAGSGDLSADPLFYDTAALDFRIAPYSPCVDAGHPGAQFNDPDGTRNDMGAFASERSNPDVMNLGLHGEDRFHVISHSPSIVWGYRDTLATQTNYEIEVGTNDDWSIAEMWTSGTVASPDTLVSYEGNPLVDGVVYYLRARVYNGIAWGEWRRISFRMNSVPSIPAQLRPVGGVETVALGTVLVIGNSSDGEADPLSYTFEVYADAVLSTLIKTDSGVAAGPDSTFVTLADDLPPDADYWWRVRANDGWEFSAWSVAEEFHARSSMSFDVPGEYATIPDAVTAASEFDTILVYPGTYATNLNLITKQVRLVSAGGPHLTTLTQQSAGKPIIVTGAPGVSRSEIVGFTFVVPSTAPAVRVASGMPVLRGNIFRDSPTAYGPPPVQVDGGNPLIERNLYRDNLAIAAIGIYGGSARILNNTFVHNLRGFFTLTSQGVAVNNIIIHSAEYGIYGNFSQRDYNDVWMNNPDYASGTAGPHDISADPLFVDTGAGDFSLLSTSPCLNAGDPDPVYYDPDGTRADIGAYPFAGPLPIGVSIYVFAEDQFHVIAEYPRFRWSFYDTVGTMSGYEIEVGSDNEWSTAEQWTSGTVYTTLNIAQYAGSTLQDGNPYYVRLRLYNGSDWGAWTYFLFRMNTAPTMPVSISPLALDTLHFQMIRLAVQNSADDEGDSIVYEFELFEDSTLLSLHSTTFVANAEPETMTPVFEDLQVFQSYWWRVRAHDGWEYSNWSESREFLARGPGIVRVPQRWPSIAEGISEASHEDTVLVSPGTYYENINLDGKSIHLLSTSGAVSTVLSPQNQSLHTILLGSTPAAECEIAGFTFTGGQAGSVISLNGGVPRIHNNVFRNFNGQGSPSMVLHVVGGAPEVFRNVFYQNQGTACIGIYGGTASIINNTFDRNEGGILQILGSGVVRNNIVTGSETFGIYGANLDADYNCVFENYPNYQQFGGGPNDVIASPVYYDGLGGDFRLQSGSPCINAGDPDPLYNDADGSRNDMGALAAVCDCGCHSDPLCDHATDMLDVIFVIGNAFRGLSELKDDFCFSHVDGSVGGRTDVNCNGYTDIVDVIRIIDVAFRGADPSSIVCASCDVP